MATGFHIAGCLVMHLHLCDTANTQNRFVSVHNCCQLQAWFAYASLVIKRNKHNIPVVGCLIPSNDPLCGSTSDSTQWEGGLRS